MSRRQREFNKKKATHQYLYTLFTVSYLSSLSMPGKTKNFFKS